MKKALLILLSVIVVAIAGLFAYVSFALPNVAEAEEIDIEATPERLARGQYLVETVSGCVDCHSKRDFTKWAGPIKPESKGGGGEGWTEEMGLPGNIYSSNITPTNLADWTDGEIVRAIKSGVNKDGRALFPVMPYHNFRHASKEDIYSIVSYLRTLEPNSNTPPKSTLNFPMSLIVNFIPSDAEFGEMPDKANTIEYGEYMTKLAACADCHTPMEKGEYIEGMEFAGGMDLIFEDGSLCRSANLTPDKETGIGRYTEEEFVNLFKKYNDSIYIDKPLDENQVNTMMPWLVYKDMTEYDLKAIYSYLSSLKPINNRIITFEKNKGS
ncbi:MAG: cytochrome c [Chlorobiota bacterium]